MSDCNFTPEDRTLLPLTCEARENLSGLAERQIAEAEAALKSAETKLEKRAEAICLNVANLTKTFLCFNYRRMPLRDQIAAGRRVLEREGLYTEWIGDPEAFEQLTEDEQAEWIQYAETSFMLHRAFYERHLALLAAARDAGTPQSAEQIFESRIVLGTLAGILREWQAWRRGTGKYPLDRWNYDAGPWTGASWEA